MFHFAEPSLIVSRIRGCSPRIAISREQIFNLTWHTCFLLRSCHHRIARCVTVLDYQQVYGESTANNSSDHAWLIVTGEKSFAVFNDARARTGILKMKTKRSDGKWFSYKIPWSKILWLKITRSKTRFNDGS